MAHEIAKSAEVSKWCVIGLQTNEATWSFIGLARTILGPHARNGNGQIKVVTSQIKSI